MDYEDPDRYLTKCQEYLLQIPDSNKVSVLGKRLIGAAEKWWLCYKPMNLSFERFSDPLRVQFDIDTQGFDFLREGHNFATDFQTRGQHRCQRGHEAQASNEHDLCLSSIARQTVCRGPVTDCICVSSNVSQELAKISQQSV
uniref:Uncharacterized protein n=1 Tax=Trichogramma kaykai TaxID=54128 RepID=A0ABD2VZ97_9HYME